MGKKLKICVGSPIEIRAMLTNEMKWNAYIENRSNDCIIGKFVSVLIE